MFLSLHCQSKRARHLHIDLCMAGLMTGSLQLTARSIRASDRAACAMLSPCSQVCRPAGPCCLACCRHLRTRPGCTWKMQESRKRPTSGAMGMATSFAGFKATGIASAGAVPRRIAVASCTILRIWCSMKLWPTMRICSQSWPCMDTATCRPLPFRALPHGMQQARDWRCADLLSYLGCWSLPCACTVMHTAFGTARKMP